jgi:hypothetical protein
VDISVYQLQVSQVTSLKASGRLNLLLEEGKRCMRGSAGMAMSERTLKQPLGLLWDIEVSMKSAMSLLSFVKQGFRFLQIIDLCMFVKGPLVVS